MGSDEMEWNGNKRKGEKRKEKERKEKKKRNYMKWKNETMWNQRNGNVREKWRDIKGNEM